MPFAIVRNDITKMQVDAIVNTANPGPRIGSGVDAGIHTAAGPRLLEARQAIGPIRPGCSAVTPAFDLNAKYVIHTVGPVWRGGLFGERKLLRSCYDSALELALEHGCQSIAFPLISSGNYGFPRDKALQIAVAAFSEFLMEHELQIYLVVFNREAFSLSKKLVQSVASYIDEHYVQRKLREEYGSFAPNAAMPSPARRREWEQPTPPRPMSDTLAERTVRACPGMSAPELLSLEDVLKQEDAGFTERLLELIDQSGKKDSQIYKKANLSKQHFSKIRNNPGYKPTKPTAIALALALELDLDATRDLIGRAGYALTNSSKFDLIIRYYIERKVYNIIEINMTLYEFDQSLLGS